MAEVATKKSINVVSSKKNEVCGVQSNNGLIDLDGLTASNTQLISLCDDDDDLVLTNNTRNELENDDKSLQELIESELALRICSSKDDDEAVEEAENVVTQPETIKRIVLDRRQEDPVDINAEFIAAESEHCSLIEEPYGHRNGHVSPRVDVEVVKPEPVRRHDQEEDQAFVEQPEAGVIIQKTKDEGDQESSRDKLVDVNKEECQAIVKEAVSSEDDPDSGNVTSDLVDGSNSRSFPIPASRPVDKCQRDEEPKMPDDTDLLRAEVERDRKDSADVDVPDTWTEQAPLSDGQQTGQFSDNFDQALYPHERSLEEQKSPSTNEESSANEHIDMLNDSCGDSRVEEIPASLIRRDKSSPPVTTEETDPRPEDSGDFSDDGIISQAEISAETASTQEFLDMERRVLSEEADRETPQIVVSSEIAESRATGHKSVLENESPECLVAPEDAQNPVDESSSEFSASDSTFIEKTEIVVSDTSVTIFSETRQLADEQIGNLDSWTTVEEATKTAGPADAEVRRGDTPSATERGGDFNDGRDDNEERQDDCLAPSSPRAPLATPDETETSDISNACDVSVLFLCINSLGWRRSGPKERDPIRLSRLHKSRLRTRDYFHG